LQISTDTLSRTLVIWQNLLLNSKARRNGNGKKNIKRLVAYILKLLNEAERNYEIHGKEILMIIRYLEAFLRRSQESVQDLILL